LSPPSPAAWPRRSHGSRCTLRRAIDACPSLLRFGLANLYRPGNRSALIVALATGMLTMVGTFNRTAPWFAPSQDPPFDANLFVANFDDFAVRAYPLPRNQPGVEGPVKRHSGQLRLSSVDGTSLDRLRAGGRPIGDAWLVGCADTGGAHGRGRRRRLLGIHLGSASSSPARQDAAATVTAVREMSPPKLGTLPDRLPRASWPESVSPRRAAGAADRSTASAAP
jgi:hypothetical protein